MTSTTTADPTGPPAGAAAPARGAGEGDAATEDLLGGLMRLTRVLKSSRLRIDTPDGLNRAEVGVLRWLEQHGETRVSDIACAFGLSPSVISRQVSSLEGRDLLHRRPDPADARAGLISLTGRGRAALDSITRQYVRRLAEVVDDWDLEERRHAARLVHHLAARLAETPSTRPPGLSAQEGPPA
jgi:DNA-binding MarR family transcriptional regulator